MRFIELDTTGGDATFNALPGDVIRAKPSGIGTGTVNLPTAAPAGSFVLVMAIDSTIAVVLGTGESMYGGGSSVTGGAAWKYIADGTGTWLAYRGSLS